MDSFHPHSDPAHRSTRHRRLPPTRAAGVEFLGQMPGSGYRQAPWLVRRADGQTLQLTPLLYALLEEIDGERGWEEVATVVSAKYGRTVAAEDVVYLIAVKLRPLGVMRHHDGSEPRTKAVNPLLGLRFRFVLSPPRLTNALAALWAWTFHPVVAVPVIAAFALVSWWTLIRRGVGAAIDDVLYDPKLVLTVLGLTVASAAFHELGHAAACRHGGARPGRMGAALYLLWPVFYTDVTDSYRLSRAGRLRVDLGGLYFNALFVLATVGAWRGTGAEGLLVLVPIQLFQMARQLVPLMRFDGYHILADLTGVPDLFARIKPVLVGLLPHRRVTAAASHLKPGARVVVTTWVLVVVPALVTFFAVIAWQLPRAARAAWHSLSTQAELLRASLAAGAPDRVALGLIAMLAVALAPATMAYVTVRILRRGTAQAWVMTQDHPIVRATAGIAVVALAVAVIPQWWPGSGPDQPADRRVRPGDPLVAGPVSDLLELTAAQVSNHERPADRLRVPDEPELASAVDPSNSRPGRAARDVSVRPAPDHAARTPPSTVLQRSAWPFPFDPPPPPGTDDNHALAVNTTDGHVEVATAFSFARTARDAVEHANRAYAYASCVNCRTVAVAFQAVIAEGNPATVAPENIAETANYECDACSTRSVAVQLVVTLTRALPADVNLELTGLFDEAKDVRTLARTTPADDIRARLLAIKAAMLELLDPYAEPVETHDPEVEPEPDPTTTTSTTSTTSTTTTTQPTRTTSTTTTTQPTSTTTSSTTTTTSTTSTTTTSTTTTTPPEA